MDELAFFAIVALLVVLAVPVAIVVLFIRTAGLADRLARLERLSAQQAARLAMLDDGIAPPHARVQDPLATTAPEIPVVDTPPDIAADTGLAGPAPAAAIPADVTQPPAAQVSSAWDRAIARQPANAATGPAEVPLTAGRTTDDMVAPAPGATGPDVATRLINWLQVNWIYAIAAASLGLAGIFFVQYGVEKGLLPPPLRVLAGIAFGAGLIAAGEWLRRRHGDEGGTTTQYLPSVFSGAGLVSVFAATLAARHMYGLIGPETAFAGHLFTAALAVALGWFYGPLLAAVGLIGAALSPFIVAGGSDAAPWLYAYFALITATGLGIDAVRQWRWVAVLALVLGYPGTVLVGVGGGGVPGFALTMLVLAAIAIIIPPLSLTPSHPGPFTLQAALGQSNKVPLSFAVKLGMGAAVASSLLLFLSGMGPNNHLISPLALTVFAIGALLWARRAEGLTDLALLPATAFVAWIAVEGFTSGPVLSMLEGFPWKTTDHTIARPQAITWLTLMAAAISAAAAWRALRAGPDRLVNVMFGLIAVLTLSLSVAGLELLWAPARFIGDYPWALHIIAAAAIMTGLATRFAAVDMGDMRRTAHATLAALSLIALALFLLTTATALTLALAVLLVTAAALDRRFNLPEMGLFQQIGTAVLSWRLLFDPGLDFALDGPLASVTLAFAGSIAAFAAARWMAQERPRPLTLAVLESAGAALAAVFGSVLITRLILPEGWFPYEGHWQASLMALPWLILMGVQLYRAQVTGWLQRARQGLAAIAGIIAACWLFAAAFPFNPLFSYGPENLTGLVTGPILINSLFIAYALPGLLLLAMRPYMPAILRLPFLCIGAALIALYGALEIRHWFQGPWLGDIGVMQGELYTYTLALMALGAALLIQSIRKASPLLRRVAMVVIGITIAKVFFVDAAGLTGLTRVFSFLGLGLSLAGLAWLNRWAERAARAD
ncbi:MAG: DUF2339 domain-containing protein [Rhodobacteraceae bacterium]|nr:DUF2339 domain-containing protein [Paracoccaceae bacterium]